ncbi:methylisocitrate lyase [Fusarium beomiforme]|uniref:Methylisocitrate lyase n=1 Tax=Fusarium beomiforme TaxID=44412 RepID=A0A9P5AL44_9HYPO|nr:methylisocitrate lyase [Fusarium beomiforme]
MSKSIVNTNPYPFRFEASQYPAIKPNGKGVTIDYTNFRGSRPSLQASRLRAMVFAQAGAAGVMIEDQSWPKRCGHTAGKSVVSRIEAYARWQAAVDARKDGQDIWILARTDSLIHGYDEALTRARKAIEIGVDAVFVEALPDRESMARLRKDLDFAMIANIIEGGKIQNLSAKDLAELGYSLVCYP